MKILFFGTPPFAAQVLEYLLKNKVEVVAVVTRPDQPKGRSGTPRPSAVKECALAAKLPLFQPLKASDPLFIETLKSFDAELFIVVAYGEILRQHVLDIPQKGCINLHASLLPKYRGAAPIQWSIIRGEVETGVTVMHMVRQMDAGDIIEKVPVAIESNMTARELESALCKVGSDVLLKVIHEIEQNAAKKTPQDHSQVTFAPKIELEDCQINWNRPAQELHNLIRGVSPSPGAWCYVKIKDKTLRLKIYRTDVVNTSQIAPPGTMLSYNSGIVISCKKDALRILTLQLEGKREMNAEEFVKGMSNPLLFIV